ncbi:hypothetical protein ACKC9G_12975 [Pokkaliibacter sp. CJK22405]|uniref:hypothetical protein n=1 Tax=Pokkaliibacter sp. CJK22405 TaxID=3384615 RepID=UPI00398478A4
MMNRRAPLLFILSLCSLSGGAVQATPLDISTGCDGSPSLLQGLSILRNDTLTEMRDYQGDNRLLNTRYRTRIGKALLTITFAPNLQSIIRRYSEPGVPEQEQDYQFRCSGMGSFQAQDVEIRLVKGGLIMRELRPDSMAIPSSISVFYEPSP